VKVRPTHNRTRWTATFVTDAKTVKVRITARQSNGKLTSSTRTITVC
jgi:hypothetical protein